MANKCSSVPKFDWAELNLDLLPFIAHKLGDAIDFIRFRAVCKKWRSATNLSDKPPQLPWLMMLTKYHDMAEVCFHALPSGKIFSLSFLNHRDYSVAYNRKGSNEFQFYEIDEECNLKDFIKKFVAHN
ncbi:F-box protein [Carex littledalei]|uniref:F-box protein n=1 Tax=Carex littledalei TaxID=544730 RepID=A0A833R528_9POAL|nr:F-box protein [Carex littledalei]